MKKFEYKTVEFEPNGKFVKTIKIEAKAFEEILNEMGNEGWELVNSIDYALEGYTQKVILFFKREKE